MSTPNVELKDLIRTLRMKPKNARAILRRHGIKSADDDRWTFKKKDVDHVKQVLKEARRAA